MTREQAFLAILASVKGEQYVSDFPRDSRFAQELSFGTVRMAATLDHVAESLTSRGKLSLKIKEKVLLRMALYQYIFMDKVPIHAIANETMELAKKYCHKSFAGFLNAVLRKLPMAEYSFPDLATRYSYPDYFIRHLLKDYGPEKTEEILQLGNKPGRTMYRERATGKMEFLTDSLEEIAQSPDFYIQNATPAALIAKLSEGIVPPSTILDLCAAPGGKLIALHDRFPQAKLFANDLRMKRLEENCKKYGIPASLSSLPGEKYDLTPADLVILDVPCSNSGVLNKRPEARWRLSHENLEQLEKLQLALLENGVKLGGEIWYMTCSILKRENEKFMEKVCKQFNLRIRNQVTILPNSEGWDGGFACALQKL